MIDLKTKPLYHQQKAIDKLCRLKVGALFMEPGTGKTRTTLGLIKPRLDAGKINHVLWLCPCSCKVNLIRDIRKHAEIDDRVLTICGIETLSSSVRENIRLQQLVRENKCMIVVDESLLIKNPHAKRSQNIHLLSQFAEYKVILNGTPISRTEADLYSQMRFLDWRILGYPSYYSFAANHLEIDDKTGRIQRVFNLDYLTNKIAPYSYQVTKEECLNLPPKRQYQFWFGMTSEQSRIYEETKEAFLSHLILGTRYENVAIYRTLTALQQVASGRAIITPPNQSIKHVSIFKSPNNNPRIRALQTVLDKYVPNQQQAIIWYRYQHEKDSIVQALTDQGETVAEINGAQSAKMRQNALDCHASKRVRFLVANKDCAGLGLDLQYCNYGIYYNNDWNWATREQSEDRMHRIGQNNPLTLIDIMADCSIDERIFESLCKKSRLSDGLKKELKKKNKQELSAWLDGKAGEKHAIDRLIDGTEAN